MEDHKNEDFEDDDDLDKEEESSREFAALLDSYMTDETMTDIRVGDKITGEVIAIGTDSVYINTGGKEDGVIEKAELLDENGALSCNEGDQLTLFVVAAGDGEIRLSKAIAASGNADMLYEAHQNRVPVEGKVSETCKGGFRVKIMGHNAFCPVSQMDVQYVEDPETFVGATLEFLIERIESGGRNLVVNRRRHLERLQAEAREVFLKTVTTGDVVEGRVTRIMPYGAFIELHAGVEGMAHISELGWSRVSDPAEVVKVDETMPVKILSIEKAGGKSGGPKISLSIKQAGQDPWKTITDKFKSGDKVTGRVTRCAPFGAFVELAPGIEGLVHISEMSFTRRIVKAEDVVTPGETVAVTVVAVDAVNRRLSLSIREAEGDPWLTVSDRLSVGQVVTGTIERKADFGYFITLAPGITGLMPKSNIDTAADPKAIDKLKADDPIPVRIDAINLEDRKITLAPSDSASPGDWKDFSGQDKTASPGLGVLGQKLKEAMKSGK